MVTPVWVVTVAGEPDAWMLTAVRCWVVSAKTRLAPFESTGRTSGDQLCIFPRALNLVADGIGPVRQRDHVGVGLGSARPGIFEHDLAGPVLEGLLVERDRRREARRRGERAVRAGCRDSEDRRPFEDSEGGHTGGAGEEGSARELTARRRVRTPACSATSVRTSCHGSPDRKTCPPPGLYQSRTFSIPPRSAFTSRLSGCLVRITRAADDTGCNAATRLVVPILTPHPGVRDARCWVSDTVPGPVEPGSAARLPAQGAVPVRSRWRGSRPAGSAARSSPERLTW